MARRRNEGNETVHRLLEWDRGQAASERLAAQALLAEGFRAVDPAHPLGGPDGLKDVLCERDGQPWAAAAYFPRGKQAFTKIRKKFESDLKGADQMGFAFVTNQHLTKGQRSKLTPTNREVAIIHLERLARLLDSPPLYGVRLEFLDIEMNSAEQVSFFASRDELFRRLSGWLERIESVWSGSESASALRSQVPLEELREFRAILDSISSPTYWAGGVVLNRARVQDLRVPLQELREFAQLLNTLCGPSFGSAPTLISGATIRDLRVPLAELHEFETLLGRLCGSVSLHPALSGPHVGSLRVPIEELREYDRLLEQVIAKLARLPKLNKSAE